MYYNILYNIHVPVGLLNQFMQTPPDIHLDCVKQVLRYVSGTMYYNILYKSITPIRLEGYTNADWADYKADRRSTSWFAFSLDRGAISSSSKKQPTVALSSTEAEYKDAIVASHEVVWLKRILKDLGVPIKDPILLYLETWSSMLEPSKSKCIITSSESVFWQEMSTCNTSARTCRRLTSSRRPWESTSYGSSRQTSIFRLSTSRARGGARSRCESVTQST